MSTNVDGSSDTNWSGHQLTNRGEKPSTNNLSVVLKVFFKMKIDNQLTLERMEPSSWSVLIFQPKGRLFKSEFVVGGLQSKTIFSGIYLSQHVSNLCLSSFSSVIMSKNHISSDQVW